MRTHILHDSARVTLCGFPRARLAVAKQLEDATCKLCLQQVLITLDDYSYSTAFESLPATQRRTIFRTAYAIECQLHAVIADSEPLRTVVEDDPCLSQATAFVPTDDGNRRYAEPLSFRLRRKTHVEYEGSRRGQRPMYRKAGSLWWYEGRGQRFEVQPVPFYSRSLDAKPRRDTASPDWWLWATRKTRD